MTSSREGGPSQEAIGTSYAKGAVAREPDEPSTQQVKGMSIPQVREASALHVDDDEDSEDIPPQAEGDASVQWLTNLIQQAERFTIQEQPAETKQDDKVRVTNILNTLFLLTGENVKSLTQQQESHTLETQESTAHQAEDDTTKRAEDTYAEA